MDPTKVTTPTQRKEDRLPGSPGVLNVILHGLFTIVADDTEITFYIPNMGSEHVYKAGNWLAETTIAQGDFELKGVNPAPRSEQPFKPAQNIVVDRARVIDANCCARVYATLHFPYPRSIHSLGRLSIPPGAIVGDSTGMINPGSGNGKQAASVQVLTYDFTSDSEIHLGNHPWEPVLDGGYVNLHILADNEDTPDQEHIRHAFQMSIGLLAGVDLALKLPMGPANPKDEEGEIQALANAGVHPFELFGLIKRQRLMGVLGRAIKEHRDLNGFWQDPSAFDGSDLGSCPPGSVT